MSLAEENPYRDPETRGPQRSERVNYWRLWPTVVIAALTFLGASQRIWMPLALGFLIIPIQAIMLIFTALFRRKREHALHLRFIRFVIYALTLSAALGVAIMEERLIEAQADELVAACEAFERVEGHLPNELSELVPVYRPSIPVALGRFVFLSGTFYFYQPPTESSRAVFSYRMNPDAYRSYDFEVHAWNSR